MAIIVHILPTQDKIQEAVRCGESLKAARTGKVVYLRKGEKNPYRSFSSEEFIDMLNCVAVLVSASGPELALIRTHLKNIPWPISSVEPAVWSGDHARFIALNFDF